MTSTLLHLIHLLLLLTLPFHNVYSYMMEPQSVTDPVGDGVDFNACLYQGQVLPRTASHDITSASVTASEDGESLGDTKIRVNVEFTGPLTGPYSLEILLDTDVDPATGASSPSSYYIGLGAENAVSMEVMNGSVAAKSIDRYTTQWTKISEPTVTVNGSRISVELRNEVLGTPKKANLRVYMISGGALDVAPNHDKPPISISFVKSPTANLVMPEGIDEGESFTLDASKSAPGDYRIIEYRWDLDSDGIFELQSSNPIIRAEELGVKLRDGPNSITLTIIDEAGYQSSASGTTTIRNTPPSLPVITKTGDTTAGKPVAFQGSSQDKGGDPLTYRWDFGDGASSTSPSVNHTYSSAGKYTVTLSVSDDQGATSVAKFTFDVDTPPDGGGRIWGIDVVYFALAGLLGLSGALIILLIWFTWWRRRRRKPGDFCKEHPEVVEAETKACENALMDLETALSDVEDQLSEAEARWKEYSREIGRLISEWDTAVAVISSLTKSEKALYETAGKVQAVADLTSSAASVGKTAFKEGGEEAMKEVGKEFAKGIAESIAGEVSKTASDLLGLEEWAKSEIGIGIAKLITGIDPKKEASREAEQAYLICNKLESWISLSAARNYGRGETLKSCIEEAERLQNAIDAALKSFEEAVAGFRCVKCRLPPNIAEDLQRLRNKLSDYIRAFGDMIDQIKKRLNQAIKLYNMKEVYESPYTWARRSQDRERSIRRNLRDS